jgi:hypothetical protein
MPLGPVYAVRSLPFLAPAMHATTTAPDVVGVMLGALGNAPPLPVPVAVVAVTSIGVDESTPRQTYAIAADPNVAELDADISTEVSGVEPIRLYATLTFVPTAAPLSSK